MPTFLDPLDLNVTFVLGSGFSKAFDSRMPLTSELGRNLDAESRATIAAEGYEYFLSDLEGLFSLCFNDYPWLRFDEIHRLRALYYRLSRNIASEINASLAQIDFANTPVAFAELISFWRDRRSLVLTFNYDTIVEHLLQGVGVRDFNDLWKLPVRSIGHRFTGTILGHGPPAIDTPTLVKLHGSIDWWHSGDFSDRNEEIFYGAADPNNPATADLNPLLIPPTVEKTQFYQHKINRLLWRRARIALSSAQIVVILGYSLPPSDSPVRILLQSTLGNKGVYIVNSSTDPLFRANLEKFFEVLQCNVNFDYYGTPDAITRFALEGIPKIRLMRFH